MPRGQTDTAKRTCRDWVAHADLVLSALRALKEQEKPWADLLLKLQLAIKESSSTPAAEIRALGNAFVKIADALEGMDGKDAALTLRVVR
mgnify:FL=1